MIYKSKLYILIFLLFNVGCLRSASSSLNELNNQMKVNAAGYKPNLNRQVLLQMPFFQVMLDPRDIGKVHYGLDYEYAAASDQFNMASLPRIKLLEKVIAVAQKRNEVFLSLHPKKYRFFVFLYNVLLGIVNGKFGTLDDVLVNMKKSSLASPENMLALLSVADLLFSSQATTDAFELMELNFLKDLLSAPGSNDLSGAFFSPAHEIEWVVLSLIKNEKQSIRMACYLLSNSAIVRELAKAQQRGVKVEIIIDQGSSIGIKQLFEAGLPQCLWPKMSYKPMPLMHNKFFVFERNILSQPILVTGSANYTVSAQENNEENIIVTNDNALVMQFYNRFELLKGSSKCYPSKKRQLIKSNPHFDVKRFAPKGYLLLQALAHLSAQYVSNGKIRVQNLPLFIKQYVEQQLDIQGFHK